MAPTKPPRLVNEHFAAALLYLGAGALGLVWIAPDLANGMYLSPRVAAVTHLFTLGWLTLTIFGALGQLLPMALGAPLRSVRLARAAFWILAPGIGLFAAGVATATTPILVIGVLAVTAGVLLACGHTAATLARGRTRDVTWAAVAIGIAFLTATLTLGLVLAHNLHSGFVAAARVRILTAHFHIALVGWALIVIVGAARRLMPTFLLVRAIQAPWSARALGALALGVPVLATGLVCASPAAAWAGAALLALGMAMFLWQSLAFYRGRTRARLDVGMRFTFVGLLFFAAAAVLGLRLLALGASHQRLATAYIVTALIGGLVPFVTGILYEIVPTLAWTARFAGRLNRGWIPSVSGLYSERLAMLQLVASSAGVLLILAGIGGLGPSAARAGALVFAGAVCIFIYQIAGMWWATPAAPPSSPKLP
jgi:hypothetical protein